MEYSERKFSLMLRIGVVGVVLVLLFLIGYYGGIFRYDCGQDKQCFDEKMRKCSPAEVLSVRNNNVYSYEIGKSLWGECQMKIKMERAEPGASPEIRRLLEGREMDCRIPKETIAGMGVDDFEDVIEYCHGPLKEGLYELIIQRMYALVVSQLSDIADEAQRVLRGV